MSEDIEKALIGRLLAMSDGYVEVADILTADDFHQAPAREVWLIITDIYKTQEINLQNIYLNLNSKPAKVWLSEITEWMVPGDVRFIAEKVRDYAKRRRISRDLEAVGKLDDTETMLQEISRTYQRELGQAQRSVSVSSVLSRFRKIQKENCESDGLGVDTGFPSLDEDYINTRQGHLWGIGGWTSVGKTAVLVEFIKRLGGARTVLFSTEMTEEQVVARLLANYTGINSNGILGGRLIDRHQQAVDKALADIEKRQLWIYDNIRTTEQIRKEARRLKMKSDIQVIFIDYFQQLDIGKGSRYETLSKAANELQDLAKELRCHIVVFSQIPNHAARDDSGILEFKGAGELAACVDVGVWMSRAQEDKTMILFDVRKNRHGPLKKVLLKFEDGFTRIEDKGVATW